MRQLFIRTQDEDTYQLLLDNGYTFLNKEGNFFIFINDGKDNFSEKVHKDIYYNNEFDYNKGE